MRKVIKWIVDQLAGKKEIIIDQVEIEQILFHRGLKLLLKKVTITDFLAIGEFTVTSEICEGHEPLPGIPVHRGVELIEMGFQLLGVFLSKNPAVIPMLKGKKSAAREVIKANFSGFIFPGDIITLEAKTDVEVEERDGTIRVESGRMIAKVNGKKKGMISSLALAFFDPSKIIAQENGAG